MNEDVGFWEGIVEQPAKAPAKPTRVKRSLKG
jgi:hypothetical protein